MSPLSAKALGGDVLFLLLLRSIKSICFVLVLAETGRHAMLDLLQLTRAAPVRLRILMLLLHQTKYSLRLWLNTMFLFLTAYDAFISITHRGLDVAIETHLVI